MENANRVMAVPLFRNSVQMFKTELPIKTRMERDDSLGLPKPLKWDLDTLAFSESPVSLT